VLARSLGLVCLLLTLVSGMGALRAQGLEAGLRSGVSLSTFRGNTEVLRRGTAYDLRWRTGLQVAGFVGVPLNDVIRLRPELRFAQKGATVEGTRAFSPPGTIGPPTIEEEYHLSYLQLPVLAEARLPMADRLDASVVLGPAIALTLGHEISPDPSNETETIPESAVRDVEVSVAGGLELGYRLGPAGRVVLGTRYDLGLSTVATNDETAVERGKEGDIRNDALTLSLGYRYSF
jgi:hypothetical protein